MQRVQRLVGGGRYRKAAQAIAIAKTSPVVHRNSQTQISKIFCTAIQNISAQNLSATHSRLSSVTRGTVPFPQRTHLAIHARLMLSTSGAEQQSRESLAK